MSIQMISTIENTRQLTVDELNQVSGGSRLNGFGTGAGGIFSSSSFGAASRFAGGLGLLYGAFQVGYGAGTLLRNGYLAIRYQ